MLIKHACQTSISINVMMEIHLKQSNHYYRSTLVSLSRVLQHGNFHFFPQSGLQEVTNSG